MLGICNGFQVLCEAGLLPGVLRRTRRSRSSAATSRSGSSAPTALLAACEPGQPLTIPVKHGEGCYFADDELLDELERERPDPPSLRAEPERLDRRHRRRLDERGNVIGLMPHPEHAVDPLLGSTDGALLLGSLVDAARERLLTAGLSPSASASAGRLARPARSRSRSRPRSVTGPAPGRAARRVGEPHQPLAAGRLEQLHDRREALLARALGQRQLLDEVRRAPGCRRFRHRNRR